MDQLVLLHGFFKTIENSLSEKLDGTFVISINRACVSLSLRNKGTAFKRNLAIRRKILRELVHPTLNEMSTQTLSDLDPQPPPLPLTRSPVSSINEIEAVPKNFGFHRERKR